MTAQDFVFSWERQLNPANAAAYAGIPVRYQERREIQPGRGRHYRLPTWVSKALDDWTLEVTMEGPRAYFPQVVAYHASVPAPQWAIEEYGSDVWASGDVPLWVNGPYKLDRWEHDVVVELSPNPGYWNAENCSCQEGVSSRSFRPIGCPRLRARRRQPAARLG